MTLDEAKTYIGRMVKVPFSQGFGSAKMNARLVSISGSKLMVKIPGKDNLVFVDPSDAKLIKSIDNEDPLAILDRQKILKAINLIIDPVTNQVIKKDQTDDLIQGQFITEKDINTADSQRKIIQAASNDIIGLIRKSAETGVEKSKVLGILNKSPTGRAVIRKASKELEALRLQQDKERAAKHEAERQAKKIQRRQQEEIAKANKVHLQPVKAITETPTVIQETKTDIKENIVILPSIEETMEQELHELWQEEYNQTLNNPPAVSTVVEMEGGTSAIHVSYPPNEKYPLVYAIIAVVGDYPHNPKWIVRNTNIQNGLKCFLDLNGRELTAYQNKTLFIRGGTISVPYTIKINSYSESKKSCQCSLVDPPLVEMPFEPPTSVVEPLEEEIHIRTPSVAVIAPMVILKPSVSVKQVRQEPSIIKQFESSVKIEPEPVKKSTKKKKGTLKAPVGCHCSSVMDLRVNDVISRWGQQLKVTKVIAIRSGITIVYDGDNSIDYDGTEEVFVKD